MEFSKLVVFLVLVLTTPVLGAPGNSNLFREYIGAEFNNVKFSDVPVNPNVEFHFILSFAIDYTTSSSPSPTNGKFNVFWDSENLSPAHVSAVKSQNSNVKVARYNLDGIDIDYEHFKSDPQTFAECIGRLITIMKKNNVISFASIAPYADDDVQSHYLALWKAYGHAIDYVNFQFYAYDEGTTVSQFMDYFSTQSDNYGGGRVLASFITGGSGGLSPENGFFTACSRLKSEGKLHGIFVWCADDSQSNGFKYEKQSQALLAISH
nr:chitinase 2-like [Ipomoea batatas]